jgi:hypothetical protein
VGAALRCLYSGTRIYDPYDLDLRDLDGAPLDIRKWFDRDDDPNLISHFLRTAGYAHVRGVFSKDEIGRMSDEVDRLRDNAVEGKRFWRWAADPAGHKKVWHLQYMALRSPMMRDLDSPPMVAYLTGLAREDVVPSVDRDNGIYAILREFTGVSGVGSNYELAWHRDCGTGAAPSPARACMSAFNSTRRRQRAPSRATGSPRLAMTTSWPDLTDLMSCDSRFFASEMFTCMRPALRRTSIWR